MAAYNAAERVNHYQRLHLSNFIYLLINLSYETKKN